MSLYLPKFCIVPLEARLLPAKDLPDSAKIYLGELNVLCNEHGYCWASDEELALMKKVSIRTIQNWHTCLEKLGFISRDTWKEHIKVEGVKGVQVRTKRKIYINETPSQSKNNSKKDADPQPAASRSDPQRTACINKQHLNPSSKEQDLERDSAFSAKSKTVFKGREAPFQKRWKLSDSQMQTFNWLKSLNLGTREGTLIWWAKNFSKERLEQAYFQSKQQSRLSIGGYMNTLLKTTNPIVSENTAKNREIAQKFKESENWTSLKIHQDKVSCKIHTGSVEDVMLHLDYFQFMEKLFTLWEKR